MKQRYGADEASWELFISLGLVNDLLPVVSNPKAAMSSGSAIKDPGKVPSRYNKMGKAHGIKGWQDKQSTFEEVAQWADHPDLGICIRTDHVRAIDVDVEDKELAASIREFISGFIPLPVRGRSNSGKFLMGVRIDGELRKRKMPVNGGMIEFLAKGNQFIAAGTHKSGVKYEWDWQGEVDFPVLELEEFEILWSALAAEFAIGEIAEAGVVRDRRKGEGTGAYDEILDKLDVLGYGVGGQAFIECPWRDEHTGDSGISETSYFPRGTGGYEMGHFKCLHAHCEARTDDEFIEALGLKDGSDFEMLPVLVGDENKKPRPLFVTDKQGRKEANIHNVTLAVERSDYCGYHIGFDKFRDEIMVQPENDNQQHAWESMSDVFQVDMRRYLERCGFKPVGRELMRDAVMLAANTNKFDSAILWIESLPPWDGVKRVDSFLEKYFGAVAGEYSMAVSRYIWSGLAGRILQPGVKADMVPVLQGREGIQKSSAIEALSPSPDFFTEISFHEKEDDIARKMRGLLVAELSEMRGLHTRELPSILALLSRRHEKWTPKFKEYKTAFARRCIFFGTTNQEDFLPDEGEHRRFLPFTCMQADAQAIIRDRELLWAEARELFKVHGVMWEDAERLAKLEHRHFEMSDSWADDIEKFLQDTTNVTGEKNGDNPFNISDIFRFMSMSAKDANKGTQMRMAKILKKMGFERTTQWDHASGKAIKMWTKKPLTTSEVKKA